MTQRIMVQIADAEWTQEALYRACILARKGKGEIVLVKMILAQRLLWLGNSPVSLTNAENRSLKEYRDTSEDYGVNCSEVLFQYVSLADALVAVACRIRADIVFATLPQTWFPLLRQFQLSHLRHQFVQQQRVLLDRDSILDYPH